MTRTRGRCGCARRGPAHYPVKRACCRRPQTSRWRRPRTRPRGQRSRSPAARTAPRRGQGTRGASATAGARARTGGRGPSSPRTSGRRTWPWPGGARRGTTRRCRARRRAGPGASGSRTAAASAASGSPAASPRRRHRESQGSRSVDIVGLRGSVDIVGLSGGGAHVVAWSAGARRRRRTAAAAAQRRVWRARVALRRRRPTQGLAVVVEGDEGARGLHALVAVRSGARTGVRGGQGWQPSVGAGAARAREKGCPTRPKRMSRTAGRGGVRTRSLHPLRWRSSRRAGALHRVFRGSRRSTVTSSSTGPHDGRERGGVLGGLFGHSVTSRYAKRLTACVAHLQRQMSL